MESHSAAVPPQSIRVDVVEAPVLLSFLSVFARTGLSLGDSDAGVPRKERIHDHLYLLVLSVSLREEWNSKPHLNGHPSRPFFVIIIMNHCSWSLCLSSFPLAFPLVFLKRRTVLSLSFASFCRNSTGPEVTHPSVCTYLSVSRAFAYVPHCCVCMRRRYTGALKIVQELEEFLSSSCLGKRPFFLLLASQGREVCLSKVGRQFKVISL